MWFRPAFVLIVGSKETVAVSLWEMSWGKTSRLQLAQSTTSFEFLQHFDVMEPHDHHMRWIMRKRGVWHIHYASHSRMARVFYLSLHRTPRTRHPLALCHLHAGCWVSADESQFWKFLDSPPGVWTQAFSAAGRLLTTRQLSCYMRSQRFFWQIQDGSNWHFWQLKFDDSRRTWVNWQWRTLVWLQTKVHTYKFKFKD